MIRELSKLAVKDIFNVISDAERVRLAQIRAQLRIDDQKYGQMKQRIVDPRTSIQITPAKHISLARRVMKYAAILLLPLCVATYLIVSQNENHTELAELVVESGDIDPMMLIPQRKHPQLILADGSVVELKTDVTNDIVAENIVNLGNSITYQNSEAHQQSVVKEMEYNSIVIPEGGDYKVVLSDGTVVWLNESSELRYPVEFVGNTREVQLIRGEMFFSVSKDVTRPFTVHTSGGNIRVLGTQFNVQASSDKVITATLVEGSVEVHSGAHTTTLKPNQQALFSNNSPGIKVNKIADTEELTCWKDNIFYFNNKPLEYILDKVAMWYGFDVEYTEQHLKLRRYYVYIDKYSDMKTILTSLADASDLRFRVQGSTIIVD